MTAFEVNCLLDENLPDSIHIIKINKQLQSNSDEIENLQNIIAKLKGEILGNDEITNENNEEVKSGIIIEQRSSLIDDKIISNITKDVSTIPVKEEKEKKITTEVYVEKGNINNNVRVINNKVTKKRFFLFLNFLGGNGT